MKKKTIIELYIWYKGKEGQKSIYLKREIEGELLYCPEGTSIALAGGWACERVKSYSIFLTKNEIVAYIRIMSYFSSEEDILAYEKDLIKEGFKLI